MLALRDMQIPMDLAMPTETPSKPEKPTKMPESFDALSAQILSLTKIATSLQQEMSQLSRRSKDNATDLISLKAATNARDEDIRKSLKDLTANLSSKIFDPDPHTTTPRGTPYIHPATGGFMLGDSKPHESSPSSRKSFSGARMSSPGSFAAALERDLAASPGPISDGSASIALLEKVLREMATKEGQEKLLTLMEDVQARPTEKDNTMTTMLSEILNLVKENSGSRALVRSRGDMGNQLFGDKPQTPDFGQGTRSGPMGLNASPTPIRSNSDSNINAALQPSNPLADDLMAMLKRVKQSVAEGGGITSEVKALVRELRGEVLGMGRDIARKLEEAQKTRSIDDQVPSGPGKEEIEQIVTSALVDLQQQMDHIIEENARNTASTAITRPIPDSQEIYAVVKRALHEIPLPQPQLPPPQEHESGLQRDEILETVREAWETYKPEIELQNFGLERDEILECLSEGLKAYQPQKELIDPDVVYQQVLDAVHTELQSFEPPRIEPDISSIREAVVSAVQETLKGIEWPAPQVVEKEDTIKRDDVLSAVQEGLTSQETLKRDDVLSAVHEGLALQEPLKRDDVFAAVQEGLSHQDTLKRDDVVSAVQEGFAFQEPLKKDDVFGAVQEGLSSLPEPLKKEDVLSALQEVLANQEPIKKDDVLNAVVEGLAAQEPIKRDDILSAVQEGLANQEVQPREIEINRDDIFDALRLSLEDASGALTSNLGEQLIEHLHGMILEMKDEFKEYSAANGRDTEQVLDATKDGLEVLRGQIESYIDRTVEANGKDEIIDTVKDGFRLLQSDVEKCIRESTERNPSDTVELLDAMEKEFEHLRQTLSSLLIRSNTTSDKDEILDAIREISDSDALKKNTSNAEDKDEILNAIRGISESESFKNSNSELADTIKQELEHLRQTISMAIVKPESSLDKDELLSAFKEHLQAAFEEHHERKDGNESIISNTNELLDAFHDGVEQLRAEMDKLHDKPIEPSVDKELLENLRDEVAGLKAGMDRLIESQKEAEEANTARGGEMMLAADASIGGDIDGLKALVTQLQTKVEAIEINPVVPERGEDPDMVKKNDLAEVLSAIKEVHGSVNEVAASSNAAREAPEKEVDPDTLKKDDLTKVLDAIKEVHGSVNEVAANNSATREAPAENVSSASKEEIEALQTLLQGMKTQLDEITPSTSATWVTAEKVEALETLAKETKETMSVFATHIDIEGPTKEDITNLEGIMKDVWVAVEEIKTAQNPEKEEPKEDPEKVVKGDVKNLETLLFELKAQIEELVLPDVNTLPTKEEITNLANTVNEFKEKMDAENELTAQAFEARKVEHGGLAEKIEEAKLFIVDFREDFKTKLTESDGTLGDMKTILECLNDSAESFAKADTIKELSELVKRESERSHGDHEASKVEATERGTALLEKIEEHRNGLKADLEAEIDKKFQEVITKYEDAQLLVDSKFTAAEERDAQSLEALTSTKAVAEDLKLVIGGMGQSLTETCDKMNDDAKTFFGRVDESFERFDHLHEDIKSFTGRVDESFGKVDNVREDMKAFTQRVDDSFGKVDNLHVDMKAFSGRVDESFGKVDNLHEDMKAFSGRVDESFGKVDNLHEDMKAFSGKVDESFGKVDNLHEDLKAFTGRADESFGKVDTLQEDLKTFSGRVDESFGKVDNLHEDVKAFSGRVDESFGKVDNLHEDVKTFFGRVDESFGKVDKMQEDVMLQNEDMKAQFDKAVAATDRIESQISQTHPELLSSIKEILAVVGQHYEHSQQSSKELKTDLCALPNSITPLLPALLPPPPEAKEPQVEKYDDTLMHEKLDTIISHASNKENSNAQMEKLNALQEQLNATAREVSEMMASHSKKTIQDYEDKKEEAMEAALALERRLAQKESVEAEVSALKEEKERLLQNIRELREEESELSRNRIKLAKEVAGMETALRIRQEEVHLMEDRAEDLERRIVEGVLNHARSQLVSRHSGSDRMSLKRVPSTASTTKGGGILGSSVGMALNRRTNKRANGSTVPNGKNERRILSLSNVSGNRGNPDRGPYSGTNNGLASLKRSHSVKTSQGYRRQSCDTRLLGSNKENESVREEEESMSEVESDAGTERRTSYTGTYADSISYITGSTVSQNRSASYSSTNVDGSVAAGSESWQEPSELSQVTNDEQSEVADRAETEEHSSSELESEESEDEEEDDEPTLHALKAKEGDMVLYHQTTDSGVGMTTD
ncbi:TLC domain-containing protein [Trichophyton interdigitale]|uniref:TLC domain-containing protein n=1 Tax=Trichophyton interdigitale TaxID=101480 RepID=A0A9P5CYA7_9EURO|nr:TLC domain-containing protein [Trichophyton interdigitale]KAG8207986.1 TLC domain-containing protein [Trichophyton interdigitale]